MPKLLHYRERCIGCNACVELAAHRWRISRKDGKATLIGSVEKKGVFQTFVSEFEKEESEKAVQICPVNIIQLVV